MDNSKRFMRYALPGLVVVLQFITAVMISNVQARDSLINFFRGHDNEKMIAALITGFLASGALGYLFSIIYFVVARITPLSLCHLPIISFMEKNGYAVRSVIGRYPYLTIREAKGTSKQSALALANLAWFYLKGISNSARETDKYLDRLSDVMHGIGATLIGSIVSFIAWIPFALGYDYFFTVAFIWLLLIVIIIANHCIIKRYVELVANSSLAFILRQEKIREQFNSLVLLIEE